MLLAADPTAWAPQPCLAFLWTNLRMAFVHSVWHLRCRRSLTGQAFAPAAVCGATVAALQAAIKRDWQRVMVDLRGLDGTCADWFRGPDMRLQRGEFADAGRTEGCFAAHRAGRCTCT